MVTAIINNLFAYSSVNITIRKAPNVAKDIDSSINFLLAVFKVTFDLNYEVKRTSLLVLKQ